MAIRFRLLTEADVRAVLTIVDLIDPMASALQRFSTGRVVQPVRSVIPVGDRGVFATMPAFVRSGADAAHSGGAGARLARQR